MRKVFLFIAVFVAVKTGAQNNIGIGVGSPQAKLHALNGFRVGRVTNYLSYDSSGRFILNNSNLFVPAPQYLMQHSNSAEGLFYGNDQLEYRYQDGTPRFSVNATNGNGLFYGKLGLGEQNLLAPVHMASVTGPKMILFGDAGGYNFGVDVQPYRFQFHTDGPYSNIAFGYGSSENFTEKMRITSFGAVGIGSIFPGASLDVRKIAGLPTVQFQGSQYSSLFNTGAGEYTYIRGGKANSKLILNELTRGQVGVGLYPDSDPLTENFLFDVGGRVLIRGGGLLSNTAGTWFSSGATGQGFAGVENDNYIGFYGAGAGWKFGMNTQTGALKVNGSEGSSGQVLTSNGANAPPSWSSPTNELYTNTVALNATGELGFFINWDTIPGMIYTFTTSGKALILVRYNLCMVGLECRADAFDADSRHRSNYISMEVSGSVDSEAPGNYHTIDCGAYSQTTGVLSARVNAGTHTIILGGQGLYVLGPTLCKVLPHGSPYTSQMIVQIFNE